MQKLERWNYSAHLIEGGCIMGAFHFVSFNAVLPSMVKSLGAPLWVISFMPILMYVGFNLPPIFTAHYIEKLDNYKGMVLMTCVAQRLVYLMAALILFTIPSHYNIIAYSAIALAPFLSGLSGGLSFPAWQLLLKKTVRAEKLSSLLALRHIMAALIGIGAGQIVKSTLNNNPGVNGFAYLHLYAFFIMILSFLVFLLIKEPHEEQIETKATLSFKENLKRFPHIIKHNTNLAYFMWARALLSGLFILSPFMAIHAKEVTQLGDSFLGSLLSWQMAGSLCGNTFAGWVGDKKGSRIIMITSRLAFILLGLWILFAQNPIEFSCIFFLYGFAFFSSQVGSQTMLIEICDGTERASSLAIASLFSMISMIIASIASSILWGAWASINILAIVMIVCLLGSLIATWAIKEPRKAQISKA
ncbi:MAG: MFS transporter [Planctomycetes bacterium]|nr:MFS transporter [Planctomycetota bacterium]